MPVIIKHPLARIDLVDIWEYFAEDSEARADAFIDLIDQKFHLLASRPHLGRLREELTKGLRSFPVGRYIIFYQALPDGVEIIRILHGARDLDPIFRSDD